MTKRILLGYILRVIGIIVLVTGFMSWLVTRDDRLLALLLIASMSYLVANRIDPLEGGF